MSKNKIWLIVLSFLVGMVIATFYGRSYYPGVFNIDVYDFVESYINFATCVIFGVIGGLFYIGFIWFGIYTIFRGLKTKF